MKKSNPLTSGARAATYSRFSTGEQGREGLNSCETQDAINAEFATARGWSVVATYRDEAKTGRNLNRKGWRALLADAILRHPGGAGHSGHHRLVHLLALRFGLAVWLLGRLRPQAGDGDAFPRGVIPHGHLHDRPTRDALPIRQRFQQTRAVIGQARGKLLGLLPLSSHVGTVCDHRNLRQKMTTILYHWLLNAMQNSTIADMEAM